MQFIQRNVRWAKVLGLVSIFGCSLGLEWVVEDAVYITAEIETRSPDESTTHQRDGRLPGKCMKFRDCYPIFFLTENKDGSPDQNVFTSINPDLVDFILETIDRCQPDGEVGQGQNANVTISKDEINVWCRLRSVPEDELQNFSQKPTLIETKAENDELCGQRNKLVQHDEPQNYAAGERVVGGKETSPGDAPYLVAIMFRGKQVCGASIIDDQHILTAAHCVSHLKPSVLQYLRLLIGDHDIKNPSEVDHQERNVSKVIYHKEFSSDTLHDDIAMIKLSEPVQYTAAVSSVCIGDGSQPFDDGSTFGKLVGWGQISDNGERPLTPRTAQLRIWKGDDCEEIYDSTVPEDTFERAFCAGGFQEGGTTDACRGDSGGPLTITRNNRVEQVGIVSFGIGCGRYPGVFTKVTEYHSWLDRHRVFKSKI